ncbi:GDSL-type esterase/lipase family protein [Streptomyces parvus]|uniref:GDSL-type esterase/lipase family protein n=1 Tax=Streptomyces parvus TaxID=66428 RepID=UPI0030B8966A
MATDHRPPDVINAGISGNRILNDSPCYGGKATDRFRHDVLVRPGVRTVIIGLGGNDLAAPELDDPCMDSAAVVTAHQIISAHEELIRAARARGIKAVGATIPPMKGARFPACSERGERTRKPAPTPSPPPWTSTPSEPQRSSPHALLTGTARVGGNCINRKW